MPKVNPQVEAIFSEMSATENYAKALHDLQPFLAQNDPDAQCLVASMYHLNMGIPENGRLAAEWYEKAATQGSALAAHNLSTLYVVGGTDLEKNLDLAIYWEEKARELGFSMCVPKGFYDR
jgi:uncharacterized protein